MERFRLADGGRTDFKNAKVKGGRNRMNHVGQAAEQALGCSILHWEAVSNRNTHQYRRIRTFPLIAALLWAAV